MVDYQYIEVEERDRVAVLRLKRPPSNQLHIDLMDEVNDALLKLRGNERLDLLVLRGTGGTFSEGLDLREHVRHRIQRLIQVYGRLFEMLRMMDVVSIAAVEGRAWGGGFELALGCNLIVAAEDANFALPELHHGVFPPIACIILPRIIPRRRAMEWILTGRELGTAELERYGLLNRILSPTGFEDELESFLGELTRMSGPLMRLARRAQYEAYYSTYEEALYKVQNMYLRDLAEVEDTAEGLRARAEGRSPVWAHR
jgi:enoyl-CoA hydratase/carnithine racemase